MSDLTTRSELEDILYWQLKFFENMGCTPTDRRLVRAIADYIINLAPHIVSGSVQFDPRGESRGSDEQTTERPT